MSKKQIYSTNDVAPRLDGRVILKVGMSLVRTSFRLFGRRIPKREAGKRSSLRRFNL